MKMKYLALSFLFILAFISCKDEKSIDDLNVVKSDVAVGPAFKVTLKMVAEKDDDVALFYTTDGTTDFKIAPTWQNIKGNTSEQEVVFTLPTNVKPTEFRIDFAFKNDQQQVTLKSVIFEYNGKKREVSGSEVANFFRADLSKCTFDGNGVIKAVVKDGKKDLPSLYPQEVVLQPELKKLVE